jgi:ADP-heptose:LPS heptosyltransferase
VRLFTPHDMTKTLLIFSFGDLGDTILTVPAIRAIRGRYPHDRILLLAKPGPGSFVAELGLIDALVPVDKHIFDRISALLRPRVQLSLLRLLFRLRREHVDTVVVLGHLVTRFGAAKYALLSLATGAPRRVGLDNGRGWFLTDAAEDEGFGAKHEAEYWLEVAGLLDASGNLQLQAPVSASDRLVADQLLRPLLSRGTAVVAFHPSAGWYGPGRKWDPRRFAEVADTLFRESDCQIVAVGSEEDRCDVDRMLGAMQCPHLDLMGKTTIGELAAILALCDLVVANDSGVGHLASAVHTPVISVFGPSNDRAYRPLTSTVVAADLPCRPCFYRGYERGLPNGCGTRQCMELVTSTMVAREAQRVLGEARVRAV